MQRVLINAGAGTVHSAINTQCAFVQQIRQLRLAKTPVFSYRIYISIRHSSIVSNVKVVQLAC